MAVPIPAANHLFCMDALSSLKVALMFFFFYCELLFKSLIFFLFRRFVSKGHLKINLWGQKK